MKALNYINSYLHNFNKAKKEWNDEDVSILLAVKMLYEATDIIDYKELIIQYFENIIHEDGSLIGFHIESSKQNIIQSGKLLVFLYKETNDEKYKRAIDKVMKAVKTHPRTSYGNFSIGRSHSSRIDLKSLYKLQPFYMEYETLFNKKENYRDIMNQFENTRKYLFNPRKQLYNHDYDESREISCSESEICVSENFSLSEMGYFLMALIDTMEVMSEEIFEHYKRLEFLLKESVKGLLSYQDKNTKLFYHKIIKSDNNDSYLETSASAMISYAILKACRLGVLQKEKYQWIGEEIINHIIEYNLTEIDEELTLCDLCLVADLESCNKSDCSVEYYTSQKVVGNDNIVTGAFIMAYSQLILLKETQI